MQRAVVLSLLFGLPVSVCGTECAAGYTHKADLTGATCATQATDAASCNSGCCEKNKATCGGLEVTCPWGTYAAGDDAWKNKAATEKTKNTACCQPKVSCANTFITTPAGKKRKTGSTVAATKCPSDPKSCTQGTLCFEDDTTLCGGAGKTCAVDGGTKKSPSTTGDAWKNKKMGTPKFDDDCCVASKKCDDAGIVCPAGQKKSNDAAKFCTDTANPQAESAQLSDCNRDKDYKTKDDPPVAKTNDCCIANTETCGGHADPCAGDTTLTPGGKDDAWKAKTNADKLADPTKRKATCCVKKATCSQGTPKAGYKFKPGVEAVACDSDVASCGSDETNCVVKDDKKCGGQATAIACAYGFIDESKFWTKDTAKAIQDEWNNKPATVETRNTACCTPVAVCSALGTTTPAATATPAAPALKFSQRKATLEETSNSGSNMVWLGVGGLVGLSVLMVVQSLRSRVQTVHSDAREVDMLLEDQ